MRKVISFALSLLTVISLGTSTAVAAETKNKTITISKLEYESFSPEKEIEIDGQKYLFKEQTILTSNDSKFEIAVENLSSMEYDAAKTIANPNNPEQFGKLENITYKEIAETNRSETVSKAVSFKAVPLDYAISETYHTDYFDKITGSNITADLIIKDTEKSPAYWTKANDFEGAVTNYNGLYYSLKDSNTLIPKNEEKPLFSGYENDILSALNLNPENYRITNSYWSSDIYYDSKGLLCRNCIYEAEYLVCDINVIYEDEVQLPDTVSYTATATYIDENHSEVVLDLIYEKAPADKSVIAIGVVIGILIISVLIAAILIFLSKRKSKSQTDKLQR